MAIAGRSAPINGRYEARGATAAVGRKRQLTTVRFSKRTTGCNELGCRRRLSYFALSTWYSEPSTSNCTLDAVPHRDPGFRCRVTDDILSADGVLVLR